MDIAEALPFLLSDVARRINGHALNVEGARLMRG
jgi:hypothetical protein